MTSHILLISLFSVGCSSVSADSVQRTESRKTAAFHAIDITGTIAVEARIDRVTSVEVCGDADRIADVSTTVVDGVLAIGTKRSTKSSGQLRVIVSAPDLSALRISGTGQLVAHGIANARLEVEVPGTGQLTLSGKTTELRVVVPGTASVEAVDLAIAALDTNVSGTAAIKIRGTPRVTKSNSGVVAISNK